MAAGVPASSFRIGGGGLRFRLFLHRRGLRRFDCLDNGRGRCGYGDRGRRCRRNLRTFETGCRRRRLRFDRDDRLRLGLRLDDDRLLDEGRGCGVGDCRLLDEVRCVLDDLFGGRGLVARLHERLRDRIRKGRSGGFGIDGALHEDRFGDLERDFRRRRERDFDRGVVLNPLTACVRHHAVHVADEGGQRGATVLHADFARYLPDLGGRFLRARGCAARRKRERAMKKFVELRREPAAAADLRNLDDFGDQVGQRIGIVVFTERAAENNHHRGERCLRDVRRPVETRRSRGRRHRKPEVGPEAAPVELQALERLAEEGIEQHDLAGGGQPDPSGRNGPVRHAGPGMERLQRRQRFEQKPEGGVDARARRLVRGKIRCHIEQIAQAIAGDIRGENAEGPLRVPLDSPYARNARVVERREAVSA